MISKLLGVVNSGNFSRILLRRENAGTKLKKDISVLNENKTVSTEPQKLKQSWQVLLKKAKSIKKSLNNFAHKYFTESGRSKLVGEEPLKGKDLEKFIRDTEIYDPNSHSYIHANYNVSKK